MSLENSADSITATVQDATPAFGNGRNSAQQDVGLAARDQIDAENEKHIASCTWLMELAYAHYEASGCFADRGAADRWRILRDEAVKARSPAMVAKLEDARGLA